MDKEDKLPVYELTMENLDYDSITAVSLVDFPAIEKDFMAFSKKSKGRFEFGKTDPEKKIITGAALIPDKLIYRFDMLRGEFEVFFSKDTIEKISQIFLKDHKQNSVTVQHENAVNNIYVFESWIIEDPKNDKANALGFEELPAGTWMISMKVDNDDIWDQIKDGDIKGFSIEAYVSSVLTELNVEPEKIITPEEEAVNMIKRLLEKYLN